jgi:hypothetical protein
MISLHINLITLGLVIAAFIAAKFIYFIYGKKKIRTLNGRKRVASHHDIMRAKVEGVTIEEYVQNLEDARIWEKLKDHVAESDWIEPPVSYVIPSLQKYFQKAIYNPEGIWIVELSPDDNSSAVIADLKEEISSALDDIIINTIENVQAYSNYHYIFIPSDHTLAKFKLMFVGRYGDVYEFKDIVNTMNAPFWKRGRRQRTCILMY